MRGISTIHGAFALLAGSVLLAGCDPADSGDQVLTAPSLAVSAVRIDPFFDPVNEALVDMGSPYRVAEVWMYVVGAGRSDNRILQVGTRWVPGDPNRFWSTEDQDITYVVDQSDLTTDVGAGAAEQALDDSFDTWSDVGNTWLDNVKLPDDGMNRDFLDGVPVNPLVNCAATPFRPAPLGILDFAALNPASDIIVGGWLPREYFDCLEPNPEPGEAGGDVILGVTWTFTFLADTNNDGYEDTALKEIYYNEAFDWVTSGATFLGDDIDIESVSLHENGHAMDLGHFGGPPPPPTLKPSGQIFSPTAVMNPGYVGGEIRTLLRTDLAGFRALYADGVGRSR
jgi:hypothetical protein